MSPTRLVAVLMLVACGESTAPVTEDAAVDATVDVPDPFDVDGSSPQGDALPAAETGPPVGLIDGGGPFICHDCPCDGRTHYCDESSAGPPVPEPPFDAACPKTPRCKPYPSACDASPTCACLPQCCMRSPTGDGLMAGCQYP